MFKNNACKAFLFLPKCKNKQTKKKQTVRDYLNALHPFKTRELL